MLQDVCTECKVLPICYGGKCISGRVHGNEHMCNKKFYENEIRELIKEYA